MKVAVLRLMGVRVRIRRRLMASGPAVKGFLEAYPMNGYARKHFRAVDFVWSLHAAALSLRAHILGMVRSHGGARASWPAGSIGLRQRGQSGAAA